LPQTLRLCPPAQSSQIRRAQEDTELAGTVIPKDVHIQADIFVAHHNPAVWKDSEQFRPERFAPGGENEENAKNGLAWTPFGNGARQCIGMNFSLAEQRVVLAMLLRKYTWSLPKDSIHKNHIVFSGGMGLLTPRDLYLNFQKRF
jgi:cytochrome P450